MNNFYKYDKKHSEYITQITRYCKCGHSLNFLSNHSAVCDYCGRRVYPSKVCEFKERLEKERRKADMRGRNK